MTSIDNRNQTLLFLGPVGFVLAAEPAPGCHQVVLWILDSRNVMYRLLHRFIQYGWGFYESDVFYTKTSKNIQPY